MAAGQSVNKSRWPRRPHCTIAAAIPPRSGTESIIPATVLAREEPGTAGLASGSMHRQHSWWKLREVENGAHFKRLILSNLNKIFN